ncbi:MAG: GcrA family cell cycle regulator [Patescibacteria group bacterium]
MGWSSERVELLKQYWADGLSSARIAEKLGGVTKNGVIGKVRRLGLPKRALPAGLRKYKDQKTEVARAKMTLVPPSNVVSFPKEVSLEFTIDPEQYVSIGNLTDNNCSWPIGDPTKPNFRYCGLLRSGKKSYCAYHNVLAYQPLKKRAV